jgi:hypothetical protein
MGATTEAAARAADAVDGAVARCARERGYLTDDQVSECEDVRALASRHLGREVALLEVLFIRGLVDVERLHALQDAAGERRAHPTPLGSRSLFGRIAVDHGFVAPEHVLRCLDLQREEVKRGAAPRPLGAILVAEGYVTPARIEEILRLQRTASG